MTTASRLALLTALAGSAAYAGPLTMEPVVIKDPMVYNMNAVTILKPQGWKTSGGIKWYPDLANQACLEIKIINPDGLEQIEAHPWCYQSWFSNPVFPMSEGQNYMGSIIRKPMEHPREVVEKITIPNLRPKAKVTGYQDMPEVAKAQSAAMGGAKVKSGRVRIEYTLNGKAIEEDFYLSIFVTSANLGVNNCIAYNWGPVGIPYSLRAEKGKLDAATSLMLAAAHSAQIDVKWYGQYMYVCDLFQDRMAKGIENVKKISDTVRRNADEIAKMYSDSYWQRQASQDRIHQNFSDYIRGVQRYETPYQKYPVQLPSGYKYAWAGSNGTYLLSNEAGFDPNVGGTTSFKLLKAAR